MSASPIMPSDSEGQHAEANDAVFAIVVTHNGERWIASCLDSLANSNQAVQVIVVDNGSADDTLAIVRRAPQVTFLELERNAGFAAANNIGIRYALDQGASHVFLLNQDARIEPSTISCLLACARERPAYGLLSPLHLDGEGRQIDYRFSRHLARHADVSLSQFLSDLYFGSLQPVYPVDFVNAAGWLLSRECLKQVGGFDPIFHMYGEDRDYCNRVRHHNWKIGVAPTAVIYHHRGGRDNRQEMVRARREPYSAFRANLMTVELKRPDRNFLAALVDWSARSYALAGAYLLRADWRSLGSQLLAILKTAGRLPVIRSHQRQCRRPGAHWL